MKRRTRLKCPHCKTICVNHVCGSTQHSGKNSVYRLARPEKDDPCYFERVRQCVECGCRWNSAELPLVFVNELLAARKRLRATQASAGEERRKQNEESRKRDEELENLKAMLAECIELNTNQARVFRGIQSMLPETLRETLENLDELLESCNATSTPCES
jgi:hypothetical protein